MISDERISEALEFIRDHAALIGQLEGQKEFLNHKIKTLKAQAFLDADGTVAQRDAVSHASQRVNESIRELRDCITELKTLQTQVKAHELTIEVWRTQAANNRRGNI